MQENQYGLNEIKKNILKIIKENKKKNKTKNKKVFRGNDIRIIC